MFVSKRLGMCGWVGSLVLAGVFGSATAWAVPADALRCTFEVRDGNDALLSSTQVSPQVARVPVSESEAPGFRETRSAFEFTTTSNGLGQFSFNVYYRTATDGASGFQSTCIVQGYCPLSDGSGPVEPCALELCGSLNLPDRPYSSWRPIALFDGIPQLDSTGFSGSRRSWKYGDKSFQTELNCRHLGTYP